MSFGDALRQAITQRAATPFVGVYDVFSASIAAEQAVDDAIRGLAARDGLLPHPTDGEIGVAGCTQVLSDNLARHDDAPATNQFTLPRAPQWTRTW